MKNVVKRVVKQFGFSLAVRQSSLNELRFSTEGNAEHKNALMGDLNQRTRLLSDIQAACLKWGAQGDFRMRSGWWRFWRNPATEFDVSSVANLPIVDDVGEEASFRQMVSPFPKAGREVRNRRVIPGDTLDTILNSRDRVTLLGLVQGVRSIQ